MAMHTVIGGVAGASGAAGAGLLATAGAVSHDTMLLLIPAAISSLAALVGATIAVVSFLRHKQDSAEVVEKAAQLAAQATKISLASARALAEHQDHDDQRFDRLESIVRGHRRH